MSWEILSYLTAAISYSSAAIMAATVSVALTWMLMPLLRRYALAKPNARSSHKHPTPQGGGIAVIAATLVTTAVFAFTMDAEISVTALGATIFIAVVGAADDIRSIPVLARLLAQTIAVGAVLSTASGHLRLFPVCPLLIEQCVLLLAGVWFINLVNFMDGLDWMTVAEAVPIAAAIVVLGCLGHLPSTTAIVASALGGALLGFAPFNRPIAKVFLGDVGSLPIGLLLGSCLLELAYQGHLVAALLLPLYYLADATITMLRRLMTGDKIWTAHRCHFYQRAADNGAPVIEIVRLVFAVNVLLAVLAIVSATIPSPLVTALALAGGATIVTLVLLRFSWQYPRKA